VSDMLQRVTVTYAIPQSPDPRQFIPSRLTRSL
jgi:hypothetical protein